MATENMDRTEWGPSPLPEDSNISTEHIALIEFAHRLGSVVSQNEPGIADASTMREDANLLMSLLSSTHHIVSDDAPEHNSTGSQGGSAAAAENQYHSDSSMSSYRRDSFRFSHPSLSLDCDSSPIASGALRTPCPGKTNEDEEDKEIPPPPVLLGRPLKVDDREAQRLSADAMARNLLQSFQKAIQWRIKAWMNSLSASLVKQEEIMTSQECSKEDLKELLDTREARLFLKLRQVQKMIDLQLAETSFQVLPQRIQREQQQAPEEEHPVKRRRIESEDSDLTMGETEYQYTVCHAVEFNGTIHLVTPAGHSEITLEVPGLIEGTFLSSESGMEDLVAVEVEIDTSILSSMVEKSCRIVVRSSVEHICKQDASETTSKVNQAEEKTTDAETKGEEEEGISRNREDVVSPHQHNGSPSGSVDSNAAIVTPRAKLVHHYVDNNSKDEDPVYLPIPDDLEGEHHRVKPRRITPQPHTPDVEAAKAGAGAPFTPTTPSQREIKQTPSMVSPAPKANLDDQPYEGGFRLAKRVNGPKEENSQNLPVLVEVACAQMQVSKGLTGQ